VKLRLAELHAGHFAHPGAVAEPVPGRNRLSLLIRYEPFNGYGKFLLDSNVSTDQLRLAFPSACLPLPADGFV
jgi:hypothetical protein